MTKSREKITHKKVETELLPEQSVGLLKELHLLTRDGHLNADARRKLKQVNHLFHLIEPALNDISERHPDFRVVDVGAGKAYLGFIIYEMALKKRAMGEIISIETRSELVSRGEAMAQRLGFDRMKFCQTQVADFKAESRVHLVTALHACDTATDDALILGIRNQADYIAVVPCCQAELASLLKDVKGESSLGNLWSHNLHRREFGSHLTNVIRTLVLESFGYSVSVTELVGWEHSLKNEFIFGKRVNSQNPKARRNLSELLTSLPVAPKIVRDLLPDLKQ